MTTLLHRPVCELLGCTYPLVLAGMGGVARSELAAAVAQAGGFGFLGMVREPVALIRSEVQAMKARGVHRFGVNLIPASTPAKSSQSSSARALAGDTYTVGDGPTVRPPPPVVVEGDGRLFGDPATLGLGGCGGPPDGGV